MSDRLPLTQRQQEIYDLIVARVADWGYPPTIREIGKHLGIRSTNGVADHLKALKRKGYLKQQGHKSRTWQPIGIQADAGIDAALAAVTHRTSAQGPCHCGTRRARRVPLLGRVAAGEPILAIEEAEGDIMVDADWVGDGRDVFALTVVGDSMIDDGILDGDTVFVQRQAEANVGDIVVMLIDQESTVKRFYPEADHIRLQPANSDMLPIYLTASQARNVRLVGTVKAVWRSM